MSLVSSSSGSSKPLAANASAIERVVTFHPWEDKYSPAVLRSPE